MPLVFHSQSHGEVAVGFFNIETDLLLIENLFIFASDLCRWLTHWASLPADTEIDELREFYVIERPEDLGSLHGAIQGVAFTGFIGALYKLYPFPDRPEDFKQQPEGHRNREVVEQLIREYARKATLGINTSQQNQTITFGRYSFSKMVFNQILHYIGRGGMPGWRDGLRPGYVTAMLEVVEGSRHWLFV